MTNKTGLALSDKTYDILKRFAVYILPALGTAWFGLSSIWGFPFSEEILGTIVVTETFLGGVLGLSKKAYLNNEANFDGKVHIDSADPDADMLVITTPIEQIVDKNTITLKVD